VIAGSLTAETKRIAEFLEKKELLGALCV